MKSVERRFIVAQTKYPELNSLTHYVITVKNQKFNKETITRWFKKLVKKEDWVTMNKRKLTKYLMELTSSDNI